MRRGLILNNAYSKLEHSLNQSRRLKEEFEALGVETDIRRNNFFPAVLSESGEIVSRAADYDFCVCLDKDKYVSLMLEKSGLRLFNSHAAIEACDDKMMTHILLSGQGIPMPRTLPAPLCYSPEEQIPDSLVEEIEDSLGYPLIAKESYGSLGKGVYKIDSRDELRARMEALKCTPHLFQKFIQSSYGRDMRVIVIGHKCVAAMVRKSCGDFRSNLELGGTGTATVPPEEVAEMCEKASRVLGLDYCGVDVLFDGEGYAVCEVNSNAFFGGIEAVTHINVGRLYAQHICREIYEG